MPAGGWRFHTAAAAAAAALLPVAAALDWQIMPSPCGSGYAYLSDAEAQANAQAICQQIGDWSVVEVSHAGGPGVGGAGYGCQYAPDGCASPCTEAVCKRAGTGSGGSGPGEGEENDWTIVIIILTAAGLYVVGGVAYNYKVKEEIALPHVAFWKNVGGLVVDGIKWSKAKYDGEDYVSIPDSGLEKSNLMGSEQTEDPLPAPVAATARGAPARKKPAPKPAASVTSEPVGPSTAPKKKKKKKPAAAEALAIADADATKKKKKKKKKPPTSTPDDEAAKS